MCSKKFTLFVVLTAKLDLLLRLFLVDVKNENDMRVYFNNFVISDYLPYIDVCNLKSTEKLRNLLYLLKGSKSRRLHLYLTKMILLMDLLVY